MSGGRGTAWGRINDYRRVSNEETLIAVMCESKQGLENIEEIARVPGVDAVFIGAFDQATPWSENGVRGCHKFIERVWKLQDMLTDGDGYSKELENNMHKTIKKVSDDIEKMKFNTAVAALMSLVNDFYKAGSITRGEFRTLLLLLNPTAPHITEEMWQNCGFEGYIHNAEWPSYDEDKTRDDEIEIVFQINGKTRGKMSVAAGLDRDALSEFVMAKDEVSAAVGDKQIVKVIAVPDKLVNIVVR